MENDPRLTVEAKRETNITKNSRDDGPVSPYLGISLTVIFSLGAMIGAYDYHVLCGGESDGEIEPSGTRISARDILIAFLVDRCLGFLGASRGCFSPLSCSSSRSQPLTSNLFRTRIQLLHHERNHLQSPALLIDHGLCAASSPHSRPRV